MTFESSIEIVKHHYGKTLPMGNYKADMTTICR